MTCGPEPTTRSAPASMTACAKRLESPRFSPRNVSGAVRHVGRRRALGARMDGDDDQIGLLRPPRARGPLAAPMSSRRLRPLVGREAEQRDAHAVAADDRDLPGPSRPAHAHRGAVRSRSSARPPRRSRRRGCWRGSSTSKPALGMSFAHTRAGPGRRSSSRAPHFSSGRLESVSSRLPKAMSAAAQRADHRGHRAAARVGRRAVLRGQHRVSDPCDGDATRVRAGRRRRGRRGRRRGRRLVVVPVLSGRSR